MSAVGFEYRAVDKFGAMRRGMTTGANQSEAYRRLIALGLTPVKLTRSSVKTIEEGSTKRVNLADLSHFTYQLGVLVAARIPISEGLLSIAQQEREPRLRGLIVDLARRIEAGEQLAVAMNHHRRALGDVYVETIRAAERSGSLPKIMEHLTDMLEKNLETKRMVRSALMYPICIVSVLSIATLFLIAYVVPKFATMFKSRGQKLPEFTQALMLFGESLKDYWWVYLIVIGGLLGFLRYAWNHPVLRLKIDAMLHRVPYLKHILVGLAINRFCRIFGLSLTSGLGLIESLDLAGKTAGRPLLVRDVARMSSQVRSGGRLTEVLGACEYLTPFTKRMLSAGEQSGELSKMTAVVARHYERETHHLTKNLGTVIEPVLIVGIAIVVLIVALAIFLPMWDMVKLIS